MLNLCMLSGSFEYDSEESLTIFKTFVEKHYPIHANLLVYNSEDHDPSLAALDDADAVLVFTRRPQYRGCITEAISSVLRTRQTSGWCQDQPATLIKTGWNSIKLCSEVTIKVITGTVPTLVWN